MTARAGGRFSLADRGAALARLDTEPFDVVVVGGGITGAGVLLDAASRGLRAALVERDDFASGTSSRSSKLIHGGLRYLEQREVQLVYEGLAERQVLLRTAPHLVTPLPFLLPVLESERRRSGTARALSLGIGTALWLYDLTGGLRIGKRHRRIGADEARRLFPALDPERLSTAYLYHDARADDARLTLSVVQTAVHRWGAVAANHVEATGLRKQGGRVVGVELADRLSGASHAASAPVVVNAAGVWADEVRRLDEGGDPGSIRPAKGVHVTVPRDRLPIEVAAVLPVPADGRSIFVIPWEGEVYVGTTDTDHAGPLDEPVCTAEEVDYLLGAVNEWVREPLDPGDVRGTWAGLRPLVRDATSERTADLSRRHAVRTSGSGVVTVTGGKLTTYRRMASETVDAALGVLGRRAPASRTERVALHGADGVEELRAPGAAGERLGLAEPVARHLVGRYGSEARAVAHMIHADPALGEELVPGLPYRRAEAVHAVRYEMARTLDDVLARRTRALPLDREATAAAAPAVARLVAGDAGWDEGEVERQVEAFEALVDRLRRGSAPPAGAAGTGS